jgi:chromosome partitioning protein
VSTLFSFVTQKGGSGKTTLTLCCAVAAQEAGHQALIIDLDPQGTASSWYQDREAEIPRLVHIQSTQLLNALTAAQSNGFDVILIDTPGREEPSVAAAIRVCDMALIPCRPTSADMKATPQTVHTIQRLEKTAAFVLTQTPPRGTRIREAQKGLSVLGMVAPVTIVLRTAYQDALAAGLGVTEYEPDGKAAAEIRALWAWIQKKMEKINYGTETNLT